ncbi:MAG TPA: hypothetical protein VJK51_01485 [Candidatus Nanoarchaeia archaeon]|nr:hypothetical protein [Candidatus Nanoarchaeia archaeon]
MEKTIIGVRNIDEKSFKKLKVKVVEKNIELLKIIKPLNFGKGTEKLSKQIDKIVYA